MKSLNSIRKYGLALLAMMVMLTAATAQSRYKHVPRVKVDKKYSKVTNTETKVAPTTTASYVNVEETNTVAETPVVNASENTTVASNTEEVVVVNHKTKAVVKHKMVKTNKKANHDAFTKKGKDNSKLMDVKDVKKASMEKWVLIMIILYAAGILFLILAFVFLYTLYASGVGLYYAFLIIGLLCLLAASIILPLGLAGVI